LLPHSTNETKKKTNFWVKYPIPDTLFVNPEKRRAEGAGQFLAKINSPKTALKATKFM
jgi:hypothetical protein